MSKITVCARFRPLIARERQERGDSFCIERIDDDAFLLKDEKEGEFKFNFDKVFYQDSEQADVYAFMARPIVHDVLTGINGIIISYGQTGAGKTYSMEGMGVLSTVKSSEGILARTVAELFAHVSSSKEYADYSVKLSMVEIYMEKVRDLLDLSKDNIQIKETKSQGIILHQITEILLTDVEAALRILSTGITNRAVGETQMNLSSSRSHCIYLFSVLHELTGDKRKKCAKLMLVDLAGSEKVEKTGAEGKVLEEAKMINKSLSALGNVVCALTRSSKSKGDGKENHIPYRNSKLTRILQDSLGGNSRTALLCCCSQSPANASETLSTLRFGARASHIKVSPRVNFTGHRQMKTVGVLSPAKDESSEYVGAEVVEKPEVGHVKLLEEEMLSLGEGSGLNFTDSEEVLSPFSMQLEEAMKDLASSLEQLRHDNDVLEKKQEDARRKITVNNNITLLSTILKSLKPLWPVFGWIPALRIPKCSFCSFMQ
ncbi:hypothetical protein MLD38_020648 [Melastoma candidum]|uniref:Uncharacterized protein n=1 Tax=Melastoma candidum TaxID=119954 RepID=A0ACB9QDI8_9MYRT|nr:hypothetical protein MLD38_020648 [Melastoma candidum]